METIQGECDRCCVFYTNLNYVVTPQKDGDPIHSKFCARCTAKHVDEFLLNEPKDSIKVNC